jgi:hypothetical protein
MGLFESGRKIPLVFVVILCRHSCRGSRHVEVSSFCLERDNLGYLITTEIMLDHNCIPKWGRVGFRCWVDCFFIQWLVLGIIFSTDLQECRDHLKFLGLSKLVVLIWLRCMSSIFYR